MTFRAPVTWTVSSTQAIKIIAAQVKMIILAFAARKLRVFRPAYAPLRGILHPHIAVKTDDSLEFQLSHSD